MHRAAAIAVALAALCVPGRTEAQSNPVRVAIGALGVSDRGSEWSDDETRDALSRSLNDAVRGTPALRLTEEPSAQLVLRGSVVRWAHGDGNEVRCEVSLILADRGGSVRAMLSGRAGARGEGDPDRLANDALRAAVRGALRPLSENARAIAAMR